MASNTSVPEPARPRARRRQMIVAAAMSASCAHSPQSRASSAAAQQSGRHGRRRSLSTQPAGYQRERPPRKHARRAAAVVGSSCMEAVFSTTSRHSSFPAVPGLLREARHTLRGALCPWASLRCRGRRKLAETLAAERVQRLRVPSCAREKPAKHRPQQPRQRQT